MIDFTSFTTFYATVLKTNQAINNLMSVMEINIQYSPIFDSHENMGWYYACLFTNNSEERELLEQDFWEMICFLDDAKLSQKEKEIELTEMYIGLLQKYGNEKDWEEWRKRERGEIPLGE